MGVSRGSRSLARVKGRGKPGASLSLALWGPGFAYLPVSRGFLEGWGETVILRENGG